MSDGALTTFTWTSAYGWPHNLHPILLTFGSPRVETRSTDKEVVFEIDGKRWRYDIAARRLELARGT